MGATRELAKFENDTIVFEELIRRIFAGQTLTYEEVLTVLEKAECHPVKDYISHIPEYIQKYDKTITQLRTAPTGTYMTLTDKDWKENWNNEQFQESLAIEEIAEAVYQLHETRKDLRYELKKMDKVPTTA